MSPAQREACDFFVYIPQHSGKAPRNVLVLSWFMLLRFCCEPHMQSVWQLALLCYPCAAIASCICGVQAEGFPSDSVGFRNLILSPGATASLNVAIAGSIVMSSDVKKRLQVSLAHCHAWEQDIAVAFVTAINCNRLFYSIGCCCTLSSGATLYSYLHLLTALGGMAWKLWGLASFCHLGWYARAPQAIEVFRVLHVTCSNGKSGNGPGCLVWNPHGCTYPGFPMKSSCSGNFTEIHDDKKL